LDACPWCGQLHTHIELRPREISQCVRCGAQLARGRASDWIVTLAWVLTGLILWIPANLLPIVVLSRFGNTHESQLITGAIGLWREGQPWTAVLVVLCGIAAPALLLVAFTCMLIPITLGRPTARLRFLIRWLRALELWSIPEVYLLAVLVAFIKIGSLADAIPAAGLWCYAGMALALLIAWRRFDISTAAQALATEKIKGAIT
jgi:paraquat-inducible protein A